MVGRMGWGREGGELIVESVGGSRGAQMMKVSLSRSLRQEDCMAYSSSRVRGSEAVAARRVWGC